jgi:DNA polymerase-3 subunit beta
MKIHIEPKEFLKRFKIAASVCAKADVKPILCTVKIVADKRLGVFMYATDTEHGIRIKVDCDVSEYGSAILPVKRFRQILESEPPQDWYSVTLSTVDENMIAIESESTDTRLHTQPPGEFPDAVDFTAESYHEIDADDLQAAIKKTVFAVDKDNEKYATGGVCFECETDMAYCSHDTVYTIATDGRRMAVQRMSSTTPVGKHSFVSYVNEKPEHQTVIPVKALNLLTKVLKEKTIDSGNYVKMAVIRGQHPSFKNGEHIVMFHCNDVTIFSRLLDGRFPKWRNIIPKVDSAKSLQAHIKSSELLKAIKCVDAVSTSFEPGIFLTFESGKLTLEGRGKETGTTKMALAVDCNDTGIVKLDPLYLTSMLSPLGKDVVLSFCMNGYDPVCISVGGAYQYVVMPMNGEKNEETYRVEVGEETADGGRQTAADAGETADGRQQTAADESDEDEPENDSEDEDELTHEEDEEPEDESESFRRIEDVSFWEGGTIDEDDHEDVTFWEGGIIDEGDTDPFESDTLQHAAASAAQPTYIPLDSEGFVTMEYYDEHVPSQMNVSGLKLSIIERPYWYLDAGVFRAVAKHGKSIYVIVWESNGKHCDWHNPRRVQTLESYFAEQGDSVTVSHKDFEAWAKKTTVITPFAATVSGSPSATVQRERRKPDSGVISATSTWQHLAFME